MSDEKNTNQLSLVNDLSNKVQNIEFSKTQLEIIYAAEIIMGQKGIENTTHRDIVNLAGQKNTSAILYHFGSIEGVVNALFDIRMAVQNQERAILLEKLLNQKTYTNMDLMDAYIDPMFNKVFHDADWSNWIYFLQNLIISSILNQKTYTNMDLMDAYIDPMFNKVFHDADWSNWIYFLQNLIISSNGNKYYADKYRKAAAEIEKLFAEKNDIQNDLMYSSRVSYNAFFFISAIASRKRQTEDSENDFIQNAKRFNSLLNLPSKKDNYITSEHEFLKFLKTTSIFILTNKESKL